MQEQLLASEHLFFEHADTDQAAQVARGGSRVLSARRQATSMGSTRQGNMSMFATFFDMSDGLVDASTSC